MKEYKKNHIPKWKIAIGLIAFFFTVGYLTLYAISIALK